MPKIARLFLTLAAAGLAGSVLLFFLVALIALVSVFEETTDVYAQKGDIAVVELSGPIEDSLSFLDILRTVDEHDSIRGLLLRLDSPGGVVSASQEIHAELKRIGEKKTVFVSMGTMAASGAYYVAVSAARVWANPGSLTGSIGVLMENFDFSALLARFSVRDRTLTSGALKNAGSEFREMSEAERSYLQSLLSEMHEQFIGAVAEGRGLSVEAVRALADGKVYTGATAKTLRLIDEVGGFDDTLLALKAALALGDDARVIFPPRETAFPWWPSFKESVRNLKRLVDFMATPLLDGARGFGGQLKASY